ncbi:thiol-disulfide isomerase/thioredoxin [Chitinophaga polysaccharea]|uniref:Thiol-disulfide isomerase/thioredoxin n=1 Tax=Chitinophaga polysaccharea TaxID=1293035 RepID=A0A561PLI3_9BACT|nr:TlpA disulfide reductase family protein [Chitinophaga polysaccharea]TWF38972.1 thiol-disulfide isomerase/thioredoxin [Chitinophaga polysaccharea]
MTCKKIIHTGIALLLAGLPVMSALAQESKASISELKAVIGKYPDSLGAHHEFIAAFRKSIPNASFRNGDSVVSLLKGQYEQWAKQFPTSAIVPFALGEAFADVESPKARPYLLKAVALNPQLAPAWRDLSIDADRWGNQEGAREYMGKASAADPSDPGYAFYYAMDFEHVDGKKWRTMLYDLAKKFPQSGRGAQGLYWLGARSRDTAEKIMVFEQMRAAYPPAKFNWSLGGMDDLFNIYLKTNPAKAVALAAALKGQEGWGAKDTLAGKIATINNLIQQRQFKAAADMLAGIKLPRYSSMTTFIAQLKAQAAHGMGNTADAYNGLATIYAKEPTDDLWKWLEVYGKAQGKDHQQIENDVWQIRQQTIKPAPPFNLGLYTSSGTASLEDYKGKVVLLTFWFPGCGPCRGEFPHFQSVMDKFKGQDVAYVGINVAPDQDEYVVPFMKGTGYSFTPLRADGDWAAKVYKVRGEPTNFLIDQNGQLVFTDFRIDGSNERTLELMIGSVLKRK